MKSIAAMAIGLFLLLFGPATGATLSSVQTISVAGHPRTFYVYKPDNFQPSNGILIYMHAAGSSGMKAATDASDGLFTKLADRVGVLILFPEGKPYNNDATQHHWNDCNDTLDSGQPSFTNWDDVAFIKALVPWATANIDARLNTSRVYAAGHSNGGQMAERLALEANDVVAAIGNISGSLAVSYDNTGAYKCQGYTQPWAAGTSQAVPVFLFKGDDDPRIPFGDPTGDDHNTYCYGEDPYCYAGAVHSFADTVAFWEWKLGLSSAKWQRIAAARVTPYADTVPSCDTLAQCDGSTVVRHDYGTYPYRLTYERAKGGGHPFPGPVVESAAMYNASNWKNRDMLGQPNPYVAEEMWAFFSQFTLAN